MVVTEASDASGFLPGPHPIDGYGAGGFRFAGMSHRGSILALPTGVHGWSAGAPGDITAESLTLAFAVPAGQLEVLLVGTGLDLVPVPEALRRRLKAAGIVAEPMATGAATRTYNILLGENRRVGAALLAVP